MLTDPAPIRWGAGRCGAYIRSRFLIKQNLTISQFNRVILQAALRLADISDKPKASYRVEAKAMKTDSAGPGYFLRKSDTVLDGPARVAYGEIRAERLRVSVTTIEV
jgi:hypothetical protein